MSTHERKDGTLSTEHISGLPEVRQVAMERQEPIPIMGALETALKNPELLRNVDALDKLLAMQERMIADSRRMQFVEAMARLAPQLPVIARNGELKHLDRKYAKGEDVDKAIRPLYSREGFTIQWNTAPGEGGKVRMLAKLSHVGGHHEPFQMDLPPDVGGGKNAVQAIVSSRSYAKRVMTIDMFNLQIEGEDTDGESLKTITGEQALDLKAAIEAVGGNMAVFFKKFSIDKIEDLLKSQLDDALAMVEDKRRAGRK